MAITEADRHRLHQALVTQLGEAEAATLMEHLPPVGWADVATKTDLAHLQTAVDTRVSLAFGSRTSLLEMISVLEDIGVHPLERERQGRWTDLRGRGRRAIRSQHCSARDGGRDTTLIARETPGEGGSAGAR